MWMTQMYNTYFSCLQTHWCVLHKLLWSEKWKCIDLWIAFWCLLMVRCNFEKGNRLIEWFYQFEIRDLDMFYIELKDVYMARKRTFYVSLCVFWINVMHKHCKPSTVDIIGWLYQFCWNVITQFYLIQIWYQ